MKINTQPFEKMVEQAQDRYINAAFKEIIKLAEAVNSLLPEDLVCIWCKNKVTEIRNNGPFKYVYCGRCGASGPYEDSDKKAIERWETRA